MRGHVENSHDRETPDMGPERPFKVFSKDEGPRSTGYHNTEMSVPSLRELLDRHSHQHEWLSSRSAVSEASLIECVFETGLGQYYLYYLVGEGLHTTCYIPTKSIIADFIERHVCLCPISLWTISVTCITRARRTLFPASPRYQHALSQEQIIE